MGSGHPQHLPRAGWGAKDLQLHWALAKPSSEAATVPQALRQHPMAAPSIPGSFENPRFLKEPVWIQKAEPAYGNHCNRVNSSSCLQRLPTAQPLTPALASFSPKALSSREQDPVLPGQIPQHRRGRVWQSHTLNLPRPRFNQWFLSRWDGEQGSSPVFPSCWEAHKASRGCIRQAGVPARQAFLRRVHSGPR